MNKGLLFSAVAGLSLVGCTATKTPDFSVDTYREEPKIHLNVADVNVISIAPIYDNLPHIERKVPKTPAEALTEWANNRFNAISMSSPVTAEFIIRDAGLIRTKEKAEHWYQFDNLTYKLTYDVSFVFKQGNAVLNTQNVSGWESQTLPKKSTLATKEKAVQDMMNNMIRKVDNKIVQELPKRFK